MKIRSWHLAIAGIFAQTAFAVFFMTLAKNTEEPVALSSF